MGFVNTTFSHQSHALGCLAKPRRNLCAACGKELEDTYAFITGGALFLVDQEYSELRQEMEGYLYFGYYGSGTKASINLKNVEVAKFGQYEIVFCSTKSLHSSLNEKVNYLAAILYHG